MEKALPVPSSLTAAAPDPSAVLIRMREQGYGFLLNLLFLVWMLYSVTQFRLPTSPIVLSDADASPLLRQVIFTACGMAAFARMFLFGTIGAIVALRLPILGLAGLLFFSILWSIQPVVTTKRSIIFLFGLLMLVMTVHGSKTPARSFLGTVFWFTVFVAAVSLLFHFVLPKDCTVNPGRPGLAGISNHPNTLAPILSIGLLLSLGLKGDSPESRFRGFCGRIVIAIALIMTTSITTIMTTLAGLGIFMLLNSSDYRRGMIQLFVFTVTLLVLIIGVDQLRSAFFSATGRDEYLSGRDELWRVVTLEIMESPVVGNGFGAFWTEGKGRELVQTWNPRQSHNAYLDVMLDLGVIGLLVVLLLFPVAQLIAWKKQAGIPGTAQRRAMAAMLSVSLCYMVFYSMAQSFYLRFDSYPFLILTWITLVMVNPDKNQITNEFQSKA
ncbi:MAG: O-antigen ligase family protein [Puniceicoccaceae bacterium]